MLSVNTSHNSAHWLVDFLKSNGKPITIVVPDPQTADNVRILLQSNEILDKVEVATISLFLKSELKSSKNFNYQENFKKKSELMELLAKVWRKIGFDNYEQFIKCFTLFTELRSFSLQLSLFEEILSEFEPEVSRGIQAFWIFLDQLGICDEHKAYSFLTDQYKDPDLIRSKKEYIFSQFTFYSGVQIDFLKSLALHHNVIIELPEWVNSHSLSTDWPKWLDSKHTSLTEKKKIKVTTILTQPSLLINELKIQLDFPKGSFILPLKKLEINQIQKLPIKNFFFKSKNDIFLSEVNLLIQEIELLKEKENLSKKTKLLDWIKARISYEIAVTSTKRNFRKIKIHLLAINIINDFNEVIDVFDFKLFAELLNLRKPRSFYQTIYVDGSKKISLIRLKDAVFESDNKKVVCLSEQLSDISSSGVGNFSQKIEDFLKAIGPVKRSDFEFLFIENNLINVLDNENALLVLEEGLSHVSARWGRMLSHFIFDEKKPDYVQSQNVIERSKVPTSVVEKFINKKFSSTKLQTFIDCPLKFKIKYIDELDYGINEPNTFSAREKGIFEHRIIQLYFQQKKTFDPEFVKKLVLDEMNGHRDISVKKISEVELGVTFYELYQLSLNGVEAVCNLLVNLKGINVFFEMKFKDDMHSGSIDCLIENQDGVYIFDFKSSSSSIPKKSELVNYKKIQLYYYLKHGIEKEKTCRGIGYINLRDCQESTIYLRENEDLEHFIANDYFKKWDDIIHFPSIFNEYYDLYIENEIKWIDQIENSNEFLPRPVDENTCTYCSIRNVCKKGEELVEP